VTVALAALAVFAGAVLQSATGFGFALVAAPILFALLGPQQAVTAGVLLGLVLNVLTLATERRRPAVLARHGALLLAWSLPGLALGTLALRELSEQLLSVLVALAVLAALAVRVRSRSRDLPVAVPRAWQAPLAGVTSGALSTSTSLSGPPLVFYLLARAATPSAMRDTLATIFVVQALLGLPALLLSGTFELPAYPWALIAAGLAGHLLGRRAFRWLRGERYELAVLALLALTALVALAASVV
jgi:uncharacterized membrane protein YfcA